MFLYEIFGGEISHNTCNSDLLNQHIDLIRSSCGEYLSKSENLPTYKTINQTTPFVKLKARVRKRNSEFSKVFNESFNTHNLRQRAIHAHGQMVEQHHFNQYYLFPTDGFQFLYNTNITHSSIYEQIFDNISDDELITQLLIENYQAEDLPNAIRSGSEILFFNTPFSYAVNTKSVSSYNDLLTLIT